ncbi:MAG: type II secretion system secretin GspD, partial [Desulfobacterales bacterium]|nr:type II secretion system secretin GspD [Desulfobacterales bacterium]
AKKKPEKRFVTIDFDNVDVLLFIKFMSEVTGKNFVVDNKVRGNVTIVSPTKISVDEAYRVFESVLEVHGFTTVPSGSIVKVVPSLAARGKSVETRLREEFVAAEDKVVTQVIRLDYANPDELKKLFAPLISKSSVIVSYHPTGMLIVTDVLSNIKRLLSIIRAIDVVGIGEEISVVPLEYATASVMTKPLTTIFKTGRVRTARKGAPSVAPGINIVADDRTNSLIISASEHDTLRIKQLIRLLDQETPRGMGDIRVYYLQNADAEDLAKVLTTLPSKVAKGAPKGKPSIISKEVQIVADKATNSLVITADKQDYLTIVDVIKKLDIARRMVYIESLIMEVSVTRSFEFGVEWQAMDDIGTHDGKTVGAFVGSITGQGLPALTTGFSLGVLGDKITIGGIDFLSIGAVMRAYQKDSDVYILSTPQILTTDNEEAEITVAKTVPFLTRQETSTAGVDYSNYEYKDVGVTLNITPQINQERLVRLKISQEVSQVITEESITGLPTTRKRSAKTTVIVQDGNTVVIGGLIDETMAKGTYRVPCFGNIPLFGWFFKSLTRGGGKTNLFVFLTPHIIENPIEAKKIYEQKKDQIDRVKEGVIKMYKRPEARNQESGVRTRESEYGE